jgi:cytochrome c-type biogenesis protein CcmH
MKRLALILCLLAAPLFAVEPDEVLDDPVLEERARVISADVRCVVCQNEPIDSSNAGVARDLRLIIRERLVAGDTNEEVFEYLVARYGDFVLFNPPWKPSTYALWLGPFVILALGFLAVVMALRGKRGQRTAALTAEEQARLEALRKKDGM